MSECGAPRCRAAKATPGSKPVGPLIACEGICKKSFHPGCAGYTDTEANFILSRRNLFYLCDVCKPLCLVQSKSSLITSDVLSTLKAEICASVDEKFSAIDQMLKSFKNDVLDNLQSGPNSIAEVAVDHSLVPKMVKNPVSKSLAADFNSAAPVNNGSHSQHTPAHQGLGSSSIGGPRREYPSVNGNTAGAQASNSYSSSVKTKPKTNNNKPVVGIKQTAQAFTAAERRQWIHISRVSPGTTTDIIQNYLKNELKIEDTECICLVSNSDVCSFKVGVKESVLKGLLNPELWPAGIAVKEFLPWRSSTRRTGIFLATSNQQSTVGS